MNKYRPGGRCGGDSKTDTKCNPEFSSSLESLMRQRDLQDAMFSPPTQVQPQVQAKPQAQAQKKELVITETRPAKSKDAYIQLLLEGDYED